MSVLTIVWSLEGLSLDVLHYDTYTTWEINTFITTLLGDSDASRTHNFGIGTHQSSARWAWVIAKSCTDLMNKDFS